jgi:hypothetical protein
MLNRNQHNEMIVEENKRSQAKNQGKKSKKDQLP